MAYTNSPLVSHTHISPNKSVNRTHSIDTITIHCVVGQCSVETLGNIFAPTSREASSNYGIGYDGRIGMYVEEKDRSWCSSNYTNDQRAITIECASDAYEPYAINSKVYASLINLCADICKRNGIKKLLWKADKSLVGQVDKQNMTVHRWFDNKSCPGDYIYNRLGQIANEVNAKLGSTNTSTPSQPTTSGSTPNLPFLVRVHINDLNIRTGPGTNYAATGKFTGKSIFTIIEKNGDWGKLKSGAGWIYLGNSEFCTIMKAPTDTTPKKTVDEIAREVIQGKWGNGTDRKNRIVAAGYDFAAVQKRVNELL